jgi:hypothetical protein
MARRLVAVAVVLAAYYYDYFKDAQTEMISCDTPTYKKTLQMQGGKLIFGVKYNKI